MRPSRFALHACVLATFALAACSNGVQPGDVVDGSVDATDVQIAPDVQPDIVPDDTGNDTGSGASGVGNTCTGDPGAGGAPVQGDCADGQICLPDQYGFPGGYCTIQCSSSSPCPTDSRCVTVGGQFRLCLQNCQHNSDCRTADGYVCQASGSGGTVCIPTDGPVGTRDGQACYTTTPGPHQVHDTARTTFSAPNLSASAERTDSFSEAEGNVVASPVSSAVAISYIGLGRGTSFMGSSFTTDAMAVTRTGTATDPTNPTTSDPVLVYTRDGHLHMVFLGYRQTAQGQIAGMRVRVADSTDEGATWGTARAIDPDTTGCSATGVFCDKPWIVAGPAPGNPTQENLYVGYMVQRNNSVNLVTVRSEDGGATWSAPTPYAMIENVGGSLVVPNLQTLVVDAMGALHATYSGLSASGSMQARFGDTDNRVAYRRSTDGGRTWSTVHSVSAATDSPVYNQPVIAVNGTTIHIAYTSGPTTGAWDIMLATSTDGGTTWRRRKVNDEPDACATHFLPWISGDAARGVAHVVWLDNRFGDGEVGYARCPDDATMPCTANERVNDQPFTLATSRDPSRWHGDYLGVTVAPSGDVWAGWSDTRTATPAMYLARGQVH